MLRQLYNGILDIRRIIKRKNGQIREEREKLLAAEAANRILSTYLLCFVKEAGELRVSKDKIAEEFGKYRVDISASDEDYVIKVRELTESEKKMFKEPKIAWRSQSRGNGANAKAERGDHKNKDKVNSRAGGGEGFEKK